MSAIDLVIPLGIGSKHDNDELRILLRSAERNVKDLGRVIVVTQSAPKWLKNAVVIDCDDPLKHNKDGNMIRKVMTAIEKLDMTDDFCLASDDNIFCKEMMLKDCPVLYNRRGLGSFRMDGNGWHRRMIRTFVFFKAMGIDLKHNFESHAPQLFNASRLRTTIPFIDYKSGIGFGIYTLFRCMTGYTCGFEQSPFKATCESEEATSISFDKLFANYNDKAFDNGLRERLLDTFCNKSKYEK